MNEWLLTSGLKYDTSDNTPAIGINYRRPDPFSFSIAGEMDGEFGITETVNKGKYAASIEQNSFVHIDFKEGPLTYLQALNHLTTFYQFLTFSVQHAPEIKEISLGVSETLDNPEYPIRWMPVFFENKPANVERSEWITSRFLFYRSEIVNFSFTIAKWFEIERSASAALKMLFDTYFNANFDENTFINQCQALESFHRRLNPLTTDEIDVHDKKLQAIYERIDDKKHLEWLEEKLAYSGEPSLRKRLKAISNEIKDCKIIKDLVFDKELINLIVRHRNHYTHYSDEGEGILTETALAKLTTKLKIIFTVLLLKHLGFSTEQVDHFHESGRFMSFHFATR